MKIFLTAIVILSFALTASAQWTLGPGNINITTTNHVGIGTTNPAAFLHINDNNSTVSSRGNLFISTKDSAQINAGGQLSFGGAYTGTTTTYFAGIAGKKENGTVGNYASYLALYNREHGNNMVERMRISSNGYVGIGTGAPTALLDISSTTGTATITPTTLNISSTNSASDWDITKPWGIINFYSKDGSGIGAYPRAGLGTFMSSTSGGGGELGFFTNNGTANAERLRISETGNVGIGNINPAVPLHVGAGSTKTLPDGGGTSVSPQILNSQTSGVAMIGVTVSDGTNNPRVGLFADQPNNLVGISSTFSSSIPAFVYRNSNGELLRISGNGKVGIGTKNPDQALTVNGQVHSTSVLIDVNVPVPDYVFKKDYSLRSLADVKTYVEKNHHLPEVPLAAEIKKDGLNLGEMNMLLLKKVEELTLYMIQQKEEADKQNKIQQKQINQLKQQVATINKSLNKK